jgi:hypothetical protein
MFNSSIREGRVPGLWKCADVLPLGKISRPKSIDTDHRRISLTAVLSKILESFVFNWLAPIVMPYIDPFQFPKRPRALGHYWLSALETPNTIIRTCFIDFSKAFDRIDHNILMRKLQLLNVPLVLLNWCSSFLQGRQQRVKLKTCKSDWKEIKAGVPQGTKLGPLFFLLIINDLSNELHLYKYVDDCAISEVVRVCEPDLPKLQQELDNVTQRSSANNMKLNVKKTKDFTVSFFINQPLAQPLIVNNQPLEAVNTIKLLGVNLTSDLKCTTHIKHISSKATKRLYALRILRRNGVQPSDLRRVYCSFIRPVLEYACPV